MKTILDKVLYVQFFVLITAIIFHLYAKAYCPTIFRQYHIEYNFHETYFDFIILIWIGLTYKLKYILAVFLFYCILHNFIFFKNHKINQYLVFANIFILVFFIYICLAFEAYKQYLPR
jgi:hypothetical protein